MRVTFFFFFFKLMSKPTTEVYEVTYFGSQLAQCNERMERHLFNYNIMIL